MNYTPEKLVSISRYGYDEADDTEEKARTVFLAKQDESIWRSGAGKPLELIRK